jgi:hypothetical protein
MPKTHNPLPDGFDKDRQALEKTMRNAEEYAKFHLEQIGMCPAALFISREHGQTIFKPHDIGTKDSNDRVARVGRLMCIAHNADACVFISEAWFVEPAQGRTLDSNISPSQSPDRQLAVALIGETRKEQVHRVLPICRFENGRFKGLGAARKEQSADLTGWHTEFMPRQVPTQMERARARGILDSVENVKSLKGENLQGLLHTMHEEDCYRCREQRKGRMMS